MAFVNENYCNLKESYLFADIAHKVSAYAAAHPEAKIISLGIGNTTEPLSPYIAKAMADYALALATPEGYSGYGDEQGNSALRAKIAVETLRELRKGAHIDPEIRLPVLLVVRSSTGKRNT